MNRIFEKIWRFFTINWESRIRKLFSCLEINMSRKTVSFLLERFPFTGFFLRIFGIDQQHANHRHGPRSFRWRRTWSNYRQCKKLLLPNPPMFDWFRFATKQWRTVLVLRRKVFGNISSRNVRLISTWCCACHPPAIPYEHDAETSRAWLTMQLSIGFCHGLNKLFWRSLLRY